MIIVRLISGLGNQLFQYAAGRKLSLLHQVPLKVDVSFYETQTLRRYQLSHYPVQAQIATPREISAVLRNDKSIGSRWYQATSRFLPPHKRRYQPENTWWEYQPGVFQAPRTAYLDGYWQHHAYFERLPELILDELLLKEPLRRQVEALAAQIRATPDSVSLHVRRGDYVSDPDANSVFGALPVTYYQRAGEVLRAKGKKPVFFVFSDDLAWARQHLTLQGRMHFIGVTGQAGDCQELYLMSLCAHNVIANSSYSWWGAFLNRNPGKLVICPAKWSPAEATNARIQIQLPEWIKI